MDIVDLSHLEQRSIACNLCGAMSSEPVHANCGLRISRCSLCGLIFVNPQPTQEALRRHYGTDTIESEQPWESYFRHPQHQIEYLWRQRLNDLDRRLMTPGRRLLDIGCGWGDFMFYARARGYDIQGFEFSQLVARTAREKYGLMVAVGDIGEMQFADGAFDIVTMWHVLEHLVDPVSVLGRVRRLLSPGGILVLEVPNVNFVARKSYTEPLSLNLHLFHFTHQTLRAALEKAGFVVQSCRPGHTGYQYASRLKILAKRTIYAMNAIVYAVSGHNFGDSIRAFAARPE